MLAQLKLLRQMQTEVQRRTAELDQWLQSSGGLTAEHEQELTQLASEQGSDLHVFHALDYQLQRLVPSDPAVLDSKARCESRFREEALPSLEGQSDPEFICLPDDPAMGICTTAAKLKADLIVLGVRGLGLVKSIMVGSTTDRVIRQAPCPVLSVHHLI